MRGSRAFDAYVTVCESGEPFVQEITYDTPLGDGYMHGTFAARTAKLGDGLVNFLTDVTAERRMEADLASYANVVAHDLTSLSRNAWNEIVVDGRGNAYVNTADAIALVTPGGSARQVADGGAFPNGMAVTPDNSTLIMAESHGRKLTAFEIATDGSLSNRRVWADLGEGVPDGICLDAEKAMWYADVPNKRCVRVREGGEVLQTIALDRGCFSCALGGVNRKTLFVIATEWRGMEKVDEVARARTGQVLSIEVATPGV